MKKCPFCERSQVEVLDDPDFYPEDRGFRVRCGACASHTPPFNTKTEAIQFWNKREKRSKSNCPLCNNKVELTEFKIKEQGRLFYKYECGKCNFSSGISLHKELMISSWNKNSNN